jgi:hypothetical protein
MNESASPARFGMSYSVSVTLFVVLAACSEPDSAAREKSGDNHIHRLLIACSTNKLIGARNVDDLMVYWHQELRRARWDRCHQGPTALRRIS